MRALATYTIPGVWGKELDSGREVGFVDRAQNFGAPREGHPVFALTWELVVAKRQNVGRNPDGNDIRLDLIAGER